MSVCMWLLHTGGPQTWPFAGIMIALAGLWALLERSWSPPLFTLLALGATYWFIPTNSGVPKFNLSQQLLSAAPLARDRLYLSIYPPPETAYRMSDHPAPVGQVVRPGSTSMWAGVRLINGYSPIRSAGVARAFASYIHGEIDPDMANYLLGRQAGARGELATLGVDGIIVASQFDLAPKPAEEWQLVFASEEGRVYHRRHGGLRRVRSVAALDSLPDEQFAPAEIKMVEDSRNCVVVDVRTTAGGRPALLTFSRPYFRGYQARLGSRTLPVKSYRDLMPVVEIPPGTEGRLVLSYRPMWLVWGGVVAIACAMTFVTFNILALKKPG
jgi:hypothetical protein